MTARKRRNVGGRSFGAKDPLRLFALCRVVKKEILERRTGLMGGGLDGLKEEFGSLRKTSSSGGKHVLPMRELKASLEHRMTAMGGGNAYVAAARENVR